MAHARAFALGEERSFNADQQTNQLKLNFADGKSLELGMHLLASFRPHDRSFRWAWANTSVQAPEKAIAARDHATTKTFQVFEVPTFHATFEESQELVALAGRLSGCDGVYRCVTNEHLSIFVGYTAPKVGADWFAPPRPSVAQEAEAIDLVTRWDREMLPHDRTWNDAPEASKDTQEFGLEILARKTEVYKRYWRRDDNSWEPSSFGWPSDHDPEQYRRRFAIPRRAGGVYVITQLETSGQNAHIVNFFDDGPRITNQDIEWGNGLLLARS